MSKNAEVIIDGLDYFTKEYLKGAKLNRYEALYLLESMGIVLIN